MAPSFLQQKDFYPGSASTSVVGAMASNASANSLIVGVIQVYDNTGPPPTLSGLTVTDSLGNTATLLGSPVSTATHMTQQAFWYINTHGAGANTLTGTHTTSLLTGMWFFEASGATAIAQNLLVAGNGTALNGGNIIGNGNDLLVAYGAGWGTVNAGGSGWPNTGGNNQVVLNATATGTQWRVSTAATYATDFTQTPTNDWLVTAFQILVSASANIPVMGLYM